MDRPASADAWSLLLQLGETDSLPPALLPPAHRGAVVGHNRGIYVPEPMLAAYPNPASDRLMITLPAGLDHSTLDVLDATGKLLSTTALATELPFVELNGTQVLPIFHYNLLLANQAQPSLRTALEHEISICSAEKERILRRLELALDEDSLCVGKEDTLLNAYLAYSMGTGLTLAYRLAVQHDRYVQAAQIKARLTGQDVEALTALGDMEEVLAHDWTAATPAQRAQLWDGAFYGDRYGSASAWALLLLLGETASLPPTELPEAYRAATAWQQGARPNADPVLAAYPNPAGDRAMITLPSGLTNGVMELLDAQGRLTKRVQLADALPIAELDLREVPIGLYLLRLSLEGLPAGECKLTVAR